jgi:3-hydroxy-9,10-secoandrosta-1,3,5(10)-triene-9,17-dione monooxygenase
MAATSIKPPEPSLTPEAMIARAREMRGMLRARQAECERAGRILPATNDAFVKAGFYRIMQPRRFGGYEFDVATFHRVMIEIARGCPSSGWVLALTAGHPLILARFEERAQIEAYGADGEFRAPASGAPVSIQRDGTGYRVKGFWDYASGCDVGTHFIGPGIIPAAHGERPQYVLLLLNPSDYTIVDNWQMWGMGGTGSKRIFIEKEIFVPGYRSMSGGLTENFPVRTQPIEGLENPLYHSRIASFLVGEATAVIVGTARGALDIYEDITAKKQTYFPPFTPRSQSHEYQEYLGRAHALAETAQAALLKYSEDYERLSAARMRDEAAFGDAEERALILRLQQCVNLCWEAVDLLFSTSGTSSGRLDSMLGRYYRDLAVMRTHIVLQHARTAANFGAIRFGQPPRSAL